MKKHNLWLKFDWFAYFSSEDKALYPKLQPNS